MTWSMLVESAFANAVASLFGPSCFGDCNGCTILFNIFDEKVVATTVSIITMSCSE